MDRYMALPHTRDEKANLKCGVHSVQGKLEDDKQLEDLVRKIADSQDIKNSTFIINANFRSIVTEEMRHAVTFLIHRLVVKGKCKSIAISSSSNTVPKDKCMIPWLGSYVHSHLNCTVPYVGGNIGDDRLSMFIFGDNKRAAHKKLENYFEDCGVLRTDTQADFHADCLLQAYRPKHHQVVESISAPQICTECQSLWTTRQTAQANAEAKVLVDLAPSQRQLKLLDTNIQAEEAKLAAAEKTKPKPKKRKTIVKRTIADVCPKDAAAAAVCAKKLAALKQDKAKLLENTSTLREAHTLQYMPEVETTVAEAIVESVKLRKVHQGSGLASELAIDLTRDPDQSSTPDITKNMPMLDASTMRETARVLGVELNAINTKKLSIMHNEMYQTFKTAHNKMLATLGSLATQKRKR